jgi:pyruvate/2-oxoglutarate dehydrogenase complex dihydrolipoamide acyltransferase (E2) component
LAQGSVLVKKGDRVIAGQPIGKVGLSGNTVFPHLHLTVRRNGQVVDPFAFGAPAGGCGQGTSLWSPADRDRLAYRAGQVLNTGFAAGPVTMDQVESGEAGRTPPTASAEALVAFIRAIGLKGEDVQRLSITGPDGKVIADVVDKPLDRDKAQYMIFTGSKRPPAGWAPGPYRATYTVTRAGQVVIEHSFALSL